MLCVCVCVNDVSESRRKGSTLYILDHEKGLLYIFVDMNVKSWSRDPFREFGVEDTYDSPSRTCRALG